MLACMQAGTTQGHYSSSNLFCHCITEFVVRRSRTLLKSRLPACLVDALESLYPTSGVCAACCSGHCARKCCHCSCPRAGAAAAWQVPAGRQSGLGAGAHCARGLGGNAHCMRGLSGSAYCMSGLGGSAHCMSGLVAGAHCMRAQRMDVVPQLTGHSRGSSALKRPRALVRTAYYCQTCPSAMAAALPASKPPHFRHEHTPRGMRERCIARLQVPLLPTPLCAGDPDVHRPPTAAPGCQHAARGPCPGRSCCRRGGAGQGQPGPPVNHRRPPG